MDFSSLASYWQIKALLMLEPSVVTPQNQYFPANSERMSVHCLESGCIGKYTHLGPRDFPRAGILHPSALEIALGLRPRAISRASGCKIPALGKSLGPRGVYFPIHPSSRQCSDTVTTRLLSSLAAVLSLRIWEAQSSPAQTASPASLRSKSLTTGFASSSHHQR